MSSEYFLKRNRSEYPDQLFKEVEGLKALKFQIEEHQIHDLNVPQVIDVNEEELKLTLISSCESATESEGLLGRGLAKLHAIQQKNYGFENDNYIGLNPQRNLISDNWGSFFIEHRLDYQIELISNHSVSQHFREVLENCRNNLSSFLNENCEHASLVHGDLWSGNALYSQEGGNAKAWLIDPAVYRGDREVDIAMTEMFGGFGTSFYRAYQQVSPLSSEYENKKIIFNLYHYLNHYNLFGDSYLSSCRQAFEFINTKF